MSKENAANVSEITKLNLKIQDLEHKFETERNKKEMAEIRIKQLEADKAESVPKPRDPEVTVVLDSLYKRLDQQQEWSIETQRQIFKLVDHNTELAKNLDENKKVVDQKNTKIEQIGNLLETQESELESKSIEIKELNLTLQQKEEELKILNCEKMDQEMQTESLEPEVIVEGKSINEAEWLLLVAFSLTMLCQPVYIFCTWDNSVLSIFKLSAYSKPTNLLW